MCNSNNPEGGHKCCGWLLSKHRHQSLRILYWVLIVLGFVFAVAVGVEAAKYAGQKKLAMKYSRMGYRVEETMGGLRVLPRMIYLRKTEDEKRPARLYGQILKVEGNKITILNNGAAEQIIVSLPETGIFKADKEIGVSALEEKDEGVFSGYMNKENQLEAKVIELK